VPGLSHFNIRVYGLLLAGQQVLLSHESLRGVAFTKFPGGGLDLGEAPPKGLRREFQEELGIAVTVQQLFHVPDFVVTNYFRPEEQVLVLHYLVAAERSPELERIHLGTKTLESLSEPNQIAHEWVPVPHLKNEQLTFPADKAAAHKLRSEME
jgi:ADP-ribose pyrophosphatase YjhB (NUDIX family)